MAAMYDILKKSVLFSHIKSEESSGQFIRYVAVGLLAAGFEYGITVGFTELLGIWYILSSSAGYTAGFVISFILNRNWSFKSKGNVVRQLLLYFLLFLINLALSNLLLYLFTSIIGLIYLVSKLLVMGMVVLWNFYIYKRVIYV